MVHDIYHFHKGNEICYQPFVIGSNIFIFLSEATTPFTSLNSFILVSSPLVPLSLKEVFWAIQSKFWIFIWLPSAHLDDWVVWVIDIHNQE